MFEDSLEKIEETSLAVILEGHRPCVFYSSATTFYEPWTYKD